MNPECTLLLTDVYAAARLWERHPDAMAAARRRLDELADAAVEHRSGRILEGPDNGSIAAVFDDAAAAVQAARDLTDSVAAEAWPPGVPLRLRMGLATGDGVSDALAATAARVRDAASAGRVLMSGRTAAAAGHADSIEPVEVADGVFELVWDGREPRRLHARPPIAIPTPPTPFVGRLDELDGIVRLVSKASRLVTLTGPPGVGKTRLAYRAAEEVAGRFPDGVAVAELGAVAASDVADAVVAACGATNLRALADERMLVVWDGCDGVVEACADLAVGLLRDAPDVHVLATSREALGVPGEATRIVGPLTEADAIRLLCDRAGIDRITDDVRRAVRETGGLPSELEAAAVRIT